MSNAFKKFNKHSPRNLILENKLRRHQELITKKIEISERLEKMNEVEQLEK